MSTTNLAALRRIRPIERDSLVDVTHAALQYYISASKPGIGQGCSVPSEKSAALRMRTRNEVFM